MPSIVALGKVVSRRYFAIPRPEVIIGHVAKFYTLLLHIFSSKNMLNKIDTAPKTNNQIYPNH
jgi:hypothetical protein